MAIEFEVHVVNAIHLRGSIIVVDIVLVEDDIALRKSLADCLDVFGHRVTEVGSAVELYQLMASKAFDVAVVDINLPHYDGYSITQHLSEQSDMGIIITTVRGSLEDRVRGYESGADIYMIKPVDPEELSAAITSLASKKKTPLREGKEQANAWQYSAASLELTSPNGCAVRLTRLEALFVDHMAGSQEIVVGRSAIAAALGNGVSASSFRNMDAMLSRLRSKIVVETELEFPLSTVQGAGFSLTEKIVRQD